MKFLFVFLSIICFFYGFTQPNPKVVQGHNFQLNSVAISQDGQRIVSAAGDKKLIYWDTNLKKELAVITEGSSGFSNVSISPSGKYFSAMYQGEFWVWNSENLEVIYKLKPADRYKGFGMNAIMLNEEKACVLMDNQLKLINFKTKELLHTTSDLDQLPIKIWNDPARQTLATFGYGDQLLRIYSSKNLSLIREIPCGMSEVISLSIHPTIDKLIVSGNAASSRELDFKGNLLNEFKHEEAINLPNCFYHDEAVFGISYNKLFKWQDGTCVVREFQFESILPSVPNSNGQIAIGNWDFSIGILKFDMNENYEKFSVDMVHCEGLQPTQNGILFKGRDGILRKFDFQNILNADSYDFNRNDAYENVQTTGNLNTFYYGSKYVFSSNEKEAFLCAKESKEILRKYETNNQILAVAGNDKILFDVSAGYDNSEIFSTNLSTKKRELFLKLSGASISQIELINDEQLLAISNGSSFNEANIYFINMHGVLTDSIAIGKRAISDVKYYPEVNTLFYATGGFSQKVIGIDLKTKSEIYRSSGRVVAFEPKSERIAFYKNKSGEKQASIQIANLDGNVLSTFEAHSSIISHLTFSRDGKYLISCSWDKTLKIWDWKNSKLLLIIYFNAESDNYQLLTDQSYYFSSKENVSDIFFVQDGKIGLFDQYDVHLNRPDKVLESIEESNPELIQFYKKAYTKRLERLGIEEKSSLDLGKLGSAPNIDFDYDQGTSVTFTGAFSQLKIKQNGVILSENQFELDKKGQSCTVELLPDENHFEIYGLSSSGIKSSSFYTSIKNMNKQKSNLYLITIAASQFKDENFNLTYASKDAIDIRENFENNWSAGEVKTLQLLDEDFNEKTIGGIADFLKNSTNNDVVMVFISTHGVLDANYDYFLATYDMDFNNPSENGMSLTTIENHLSKSSSKQKVIFIDACHSGELDKSEITSTESVIEETEDVSFRGFQNFTSTSNLSAFDVSKELFTDLSSSSGISFISSAAGVEFALEGDEWKNGVFTYVLLEGLQSNSADLNEDGFITLSELENHLIKKVPVLTGGKQQPNSRIKNPYLDFIIQEKK